VVGVEGGPAVGPVELSVQEIHLTREYELITEAHAQLSVVRNCSRSSLPVYCLPSPLLPPPLLLLTTPACQLFPLPQNTHWSSFQRQKVEHGLLFLIYILCISPSLLLTGKNHR
jgi:hypothetical protein